MRLFLSSQDLGNYADVAAEMAGENKKAAFIRNAQDEKPETERNLTTPQKKAMFEAAGFEFEEVDLRDYFGKKAELEKKISEFGSVWCAGGNTFILRRAMKASGLDEILTDLLNADKILYGGWSAGSCVCAPSLHGIEYGDRPKPDVVPEIYPVKETIWDGLNLIPLMIVPHYNQDWYKDDADQTIKYLETHKIPYEKVDDGQVVVVDGDKQETLR